jgi:cyclohexyl-isocyanide hydratase
MLDFIGAFDPITRLKKLSYLPDLSWKIVAETDIIKDANGLVVKADMILPDLSKFDMIFIPGAKEICRDDSFINWIKTAANCPLKVSVCTGSLILGLAGFLKGKKATTHPNSYIELSQYAEVVKNKRIVDEKDIVTARGVSASLDLGLYLCEKLSGHDAALKIAGIMDYEHYK